MAQHSKMHLNNWLQSRYGHTNRVTYELIHYGSEDSGYWMTIAYFDNVEYGRGTGRTKTEATDNAAEQVLNALRG
ncbi:hypothetical protein PILCRDRAFT_2847 [Piloderma croceum F 1598]|uniref:DRBM domain-containing protein n=1 Tax=Piloderma croceum (strain F 1598) TaxID=765440 RepID=A0A0C3CFZ2_PILCF|nr:hypothetical protein PILCRDRAFT_2847 [Piloderma croceum F 1598]